MVDEEDWVRLFFVGGAARLKAGVEQLTQLGLNVRMRATSDAAAGELAGDGTPYRLPLWSTLLALEQGRPPEWLFVSQLLLDLDPTQAQSLADELVDLDAQVLKGRTLQDAIVCDLPAGRLVFLAHSREVADDEMTEQLLDQQAAARPNVPCVLLTRSPDRAALWPLETLRVRPPVV